MASSGDSAEILPLTAGTPSVASAAAPAVHNCAKSIIDRKLRKFASETSFGTTETVSDASIGGDSGGDRLERGSREVRGGGRVFTVRPVQLRNGGASRGIQTASRRRHDSDASGSAGSEATVASGTATPVRGRAEMAMAARGIRRPKSASNVEMNYSLTSATIHSLESAGDVGTTFSLPGGENMMLMMAAKERDRRPSNVYMFDDDSVHEFEEDDSQFRFDFHIIICVLHHQTLKKL